MLRSQASVAESTEKLRAAARATTNPFKQQVIEMLVGNIDEDREDMKVLSDPATLTEEQLDSVTSRVTARMEKLTEFMKYYRRQPEDQAD